MALSWYNGFSPEEREEGARIQKEAIQDGRLPKPTKCSLCNQTKGILMYHNEDYSPENVLTDAIEICWRCHMMIHRRFRSPEATFHYFYEIFVYKKQYPPIYKSDFTLLDIHDNYPKRFKNSEGNPTNIKPIEPKSQSKKSAVQTTF